MFYPVNRFDIKGKKQLATQEKYYLVDLGFLNVLTGREKTTDTYVPNCPIKADSNSQTFNSPTSWYNTVNDMYRFWKATSLRKTSQKYASAPRPSKFRR